MLTTHLICFSIVIAAKVNRTARQNKGAALPRRQSHLPHLAAAFFLCTGLFAWLQWGTRDVCCGDFDGYYHIKWSRLLWEGLRSGHLPAFSWLPLTSLNAQHYADQHFFFHLLLIPFTWFKDLAFGAKLSGVLFASVAVCACIWLILHYRIPFATLWLIALVGSSSLFLYRMSMTRAQSISVIFVMAGIFLLFEGKYVWLIPAAFLYAWTYNLFVILGLMVLLWEAAGWWSESRVEWRPLAWTAIGMVAGFVLNPYFPNDLRLFFQHVVARGVEAGIEQGIGAEWYPLSSWLLLKTSFIAFGAMAIGYIAFGFLLGVRDRKHVRRPLFLLLFATCMLFATVRSKRFAEYWPPVAVLFAAFSLQALWDGNGESKQSQRSAKAPPNSGEIVTENEKARLAVVACLLAGAAVYQAWFARQIIATPVGPDQYRNGAQWLLANVPPGEIIFDSTWEDFPKLFYYDDSHVYVSGLDPLYLENGNPELGSLYARIAAGQEKQVGPLIRSSFGARYVFVSGFSNRDFRITAALSGQFERVYADRECMILKVRDVE